MCGCCTAELPKQVEEKPEKERGGVKDDWSEAFVRESNEK